MDFPSTASAAARSLPVWIDELYAQPMDAPEAENFDFTTRWRLQDPLLVLKAGKEQLDVITQVGCDAARR